MDRKLILTNDGSHTLYVPELDEHFHSVHGAVQESMHVFIKSGLEKTDKQAITIFEVGFGTGLNALLTLANKGEKRIQYYSIEKYPLQPNEFERLNFTASLSEELQQNFLLMHQCPWGSAQEIVPGFELYKLNGDLIDYPIEHLPLFDLIYFDAFAPSKQPAMWDEQLFQKIAKQTARGGIFVTYCAQGEVRRKLTRSGFTMSRIPGPPGKKEMLYGEKAE